MSDAARWQRVKELFQAALELAPEARPAFLDAACGPGPLRAEVDSLLAAHAQAGSFMETPLGGLSTLRPGSRLGPYEIAAPIGSGGMGDVYRGRDTRLDREVAVKVLPLDLAGDAGRRQRFEQEARAASALNHPNIVTVYDTGWHDGAPFIVIELLEGQPLSERLLRGPLPVRKALEYGVQIARGLAAAHDRGIVHRDLKPANLFLCADGQLKILDFGIAKLASPGAGVTGLAGAAPPATAPGLVLGTVGYMSPEQVRGEEVDARSDRFSLGCVLYELIAGRAPYQRPTPAQTLAAVLEDEPPSFAEGNLRVPRPVAWLIERCLSKDREDRYSSTRDLARDLELALARFSEPLLPASLTPSRRALRRAGLALLAASLASAGVGIGRWTAGEPAAVPVVRYLTYSGRDSSPAASPDGRTIAFSSSRDGVCGSSSSRPATRSP